MHLKLAPVLRLLTVPDLARVRVVLGTELEEEAVEALGLVLRRLGEALVADVGQWAGGGGAQGRGVYIRRRSPDVEALERLAGSKIVIPDHT